MVDKLREHLNKSDIAIEKIVDLLAKVFRRGIGKVLQAIEDPANQREAMAQVAGLFDVIRQEGLLESLDLLTPVYANELRFIRKQFERISRNTQIFGGADRDTIAALVNFDTSQVSAIVDSFIGEAQGVLARSVILGEVPDLGQFEDLDSSLARNLSTEIRTLFNSFGRTVTAAKANELGFTLFEYQGPEDEVTRDFCEDLLISRNPPIYSLEEISSFDNGQGLDVLTFGGGYNCRHRWAPISEEDALEMGWRP